MQLHLKMFVQRCISWKYWWQ